MTLPASGAISLNDVNVELGLSATAQISMNDAAVRGLFDVPSGAISMSDGYGKSAVYTIDRSLRFRSSASAYLNRTPASAGNRKTWTWSGWVKRGTLGGGTLLSAGLISGTYYYTVLGFGDQLVFANYNDSNAGWLTTTQVFRDTNAWYHIVAVFDSTNATSTERMRLYVNGERITAFSTGTFPTTYPPLNADSQLNTTSYTNWLGSYVRNGGSGAMFDGYMTEVNLIDGQALTPSSFGEYNEDTGAWQPIEYSGSYGTNGFYLNFSNNANTTTLGYDQSSNSNNWTTNNISLTSGSTYDSMTDTPTPYADGGNYCVGSPLNYRTTTPAPTITEANLKWVGTSASLSSIGCASFGVYSGQWYFEATRIGTNNGFIGFVVGQFNANASNTVDLGAQSNEYAYITNGNKVTGGSASGYGSSTTNNDVIGVALDLSAGTMTFYKNGATMGTAFSSLPTGTWTPAFDAYNNAGFILNFGQRPFAYTPPTGFKSWHTGNLPDSTVLDGGEYFNTALYTANNSSTKAVTGVGFAPDLVWLKARNVAQSHYLGDTVRGNNVFLQSDSTGGDATNTNWITYGSDGFTLNSVFGNTGSYNYVGWNWRASDSSPVSNNAGSITSTVSANTTAGFSIVTYTGNGSAGATIGHGLGVAPSMIIVKRRDSTGGGSTAWGTYHKSLGATKAIWLNETSAAGTNTAWNNTSPTSSVFYVGGTSEENGSGTNIVAYCFADVEGYSKFGSYTGNGSADGPFVFTNFRPAFVLVKRTNATSDWFVFDTARNTVNTMSSFLRPNWSDAEATNTNHSIDFLSNGFKSRAVDSGVNASGSTYIYMAFAETDFAHALAR